MNIHGISWQGESCDDIELLNELPPELVRVLGDMNGFILHGGALHVRGASLTPEWHSLRAAWHGANAFHKLYEGVEMTDIPFAQDQLGDQFLMRQGQIIRLSAETGEIEVLSNSIEEFFAHLSADIEEFLNVSLGHAMQPGQLLMANPPFVFQESSAGVSLKALPAHEVILFHADLTQQIRDIPNGEPMQLKL